MVEEKRRMTTTEMESDVAISGSLQLYSTMICPMIEPRTEGRLTVGVGNNAKVERKKSMQMWRVVLVVSVVSCLAGCASIKSVFKDDEDKIPLSSGPTAVTATAVATVKGFATTKASMEKHEGRTIYELKGKADAGEYELKITADGKLIRLELEEEDKD